MLGAVLPAWGYHRDPPEFTAVGHYFLSLALGIVTAAGLARRLLAWRGLKFLLVFACLLASVSLAWLAWAAPPASWWLRVVGLIFLGVAAGLLNVGLFQSVSRGYQTDAAATVNKGGIWYGLGCLTATVFAALAIYAYTASILFFMAGVPAVFAAIYASGIDTELPSGSELSVRKVVDEFRSPAAILFALLLFFQFGNEWSIAGWLPLLLIRRVGMPPSGALLVLALYWLCLMTGRLGAVSILPRVRHGRVLTVSVVAAFFGCLLLYFTNNAFGAAMGAFFVGGGFASIYPLVAEAIGHRFPYYHPGFFNGIFSLALLGGLLAPATLGYVAEIWGVGVVVAIPLIGSCAVVALLLLIWLESKVTGR